MSNDQQLATYQSNGLPADFVADDAFDPGAAIGIREYQCGSLKIESAVLSPVRAVLASVPFKQHPYHASYHA